MRLATAAVGGVRELAPRLRTLPEWRAASFPVGVARAGVGAAAVIEAFEVSSELASFSDPSLLTLPRLAWLPPVADWAIPVFLAGWLVAALAFCLGWRTRPAGVALSGMLGYTLLVDHQLYSNHLYLMTLLTLLLTIAGAGAAFSLDARWQGPRQEIAGWPVALLRMQVSIVYTFAALAKLNLVYLSGLVIRIQLRIPALDAVPAPLFSLAAIASVATELFLAVALWLPKLRRLAFLVGAGFHLTILATMQLLPDLLTFALLMTSGYLTFFSRIYAPLPAGSGAARPAAGLAA